MNLHEYRHLQAERNTLASFLAELPEESVIERMSLEARKEKIERMIASWTPPSDVAQVRQIESHLSQNHIYEEEQEFSGCFRGVLPTRRTFEFLNEATGEVISGEIDSAVEDVDAINKVLNRPTNIKVRLRRVGTAQRRYILLAYEDTGGRGEN